MLPCPGTTLGMWQLLHTEVLWSRLKKQNAHFSLHLRTLIPLVKITAMLDRSPQAEAVSQLFSLPWGAR